MVYADIVNALMGEVAARLQEHGFHAAFNNAPSFTKLRESEVDKARREISRRLTEARKKRQSKSAPSLPPQQPDLFVHFPLPD